MLVCLLCRIICRYKGKRTVTYVTPCGMRIRMLDEMLHYLRTTTSLLTIDMFDFDFWVNCTAEFQLEKTFLHIEVMVCIEIQNIIM